MIKYLNNVVTKDIWQWGLKAWDKRDIRVDGWPLMQRPFQICFSVLMYTVFTSKIGPMLMKNREAFNLRKVIIVYNILMMTLNSYLAYQVWTLAWGNDYSWVCEPVDRSLTPRSLKIASCMWLYFICKYLDWLDTLFFILKKKFSHVSVLHIYHHTIMPLVAWFFTRIMPGGQATFLVLLNSSVHVIMHSYYCVAALGPGYQKYLWWKQYLTILQMVQFVAILLHGLQVLWYNCDVGVPHEWGMLLIPIPVSLFFLFANFYKQSYNLKPNQKQVACEDKEKNYKNQ